MIRTKLIAVLSLLFFFSLSLRAQSIKGYSKDQLEELSLKVEDQVRFLEYLLNTIGNAQTPARDKDVIIRESYLKIFRDAKVQVEDDLLQDRKVITNKDVTAYLKDIEFFYKNVEFKFKIREVKPGQKENGDVFFLASLDRTLTAHGLRGEKITDTKPRFVEVNLNDKSQELKIVSIYTTKVSRDEELKVWWFSLDSGWKSYFTRRFQINESDSTGINTWYKFVSVDSINLSGNTQITDLSPLSELRDLKHLDISNTAIADLSPISNVTLLESLNLENTPTSTTFFIKYSDRLKYLNLSGTQVESIGELLNLKNLVTLKLEQANQIQSFAVLNEFKNLTELNLSSSGFNNIENIKDLVKIERLDISQNTMINFSLLSNLSSLKYLDVAVSNIQDLTPIQNLGKLEFLDITSTKVADLSPLENLSGLKKVSADQTNLTVKTATDFIRANPEILLIHHVKDLESWWNALSVQWKTALKKANPAIRSDQPGIDILTQTLALPTLNLNDSGIESLNPIVRFVNLSELSFSGNPQIKDLIPLSEVRTLNKIEGKNSGVSNISILKEVPLLKFVDLEGSPIETVLDLVALSQLVYLNVDKSLVRYDEIPRFLIQRPETNIIFRTNELMSWWTDLNDDWKNFFRKEYKLQQIPSTEELHLVTGKSELLVESLNVSELNPLTIFHNLRRLSVFDSPITSILPVSEMSRLTSLRISQVPTNDFLPLAGLTQLIELDISNTGIENLIPLSNLINLKRLNLSGTNIKALKGLETLSALEELDVASTNIRSLKPLSELPSLKKLSCFNTNLMSRSVDAFKATHPSCEVRFY